MRVCCRGPSTAVYSSFFYSNFYSGQRASQGPRRGQRSSYARSWAASVARQSPSDAPSLLTNAACVISSANIMISRRRLVTFPSCARTCCERSRSASHSKAWLQHVDTCAVGASLRAQEPHGCCDPSADAMDWHTAACAHVGAVRRVDM